MFRRTPFIPILLTYCLVLILCYHFHWCGLGPIQVPPDTLIYQARLTDIPQPRPKTYKCPARILSCSPPYRTGVPVVLYLHADSTQQQPQLGDTVLFHACLRFLSQYKLITAYAPPHHWRIQSRAAHYSFAERTLLWRERLLQKLRHVVTDPRSFGVVSAMVLGDRVYLDPDLKRQFVNAGAMHVLAVSGLHVGILFSLVQFMLWWLGNQPWARVIRASLALAAVWFYACLTGFSPSVQRAAIMLSVGTLGWMSFRQQQFYNTVACAACVILFLNPSSLFMVGFQLSFAAVISLVAFSDLFRIFFPMPHRGRPIAALLLSCCAVQLGTFPLSIYYFHQFSTYFWLSGPVVILLAYCIMSCTLFVLLLPLGTCLSDFFSSCLNCALSFLNHALAWIDSLPGAVIPLQLDGGQTLLLLFQVACFYLLLHKYAHQET